VRAATAILLLAPSPPLLFMGQEWGASQPFLFFCDFGPELATAVTEGRRNEFARFPEFSDENARARIPDPNDEKTFLRTRLDRESLRTETAQTWFRFHRELLGLRAREIVPWLRNLPARNAEYETLDDRGLRAHWQLADGTMLTLLANMGEQTITDVARPGERVLYHLPSGTTTDFDNTLPPWSVWWFLDAGRGGRA